VPLNRHGPGGDVVCAGRVPRTWTHPGFSSCLQSSHGWRGPSPPSCMPQAAPLARGAPVQPQRSCSTIRLLQALAARSRERWPSPGVYVYLLGSRSQRQPLLLASQLHRPLPPLLCRRGHRNEVSLRLQQHQSIGGTSPGRDLPIKDKVSLRKVRVLKSPVPVPGQPWLCCSLRLGPLSRCPT